jgi:hypothetical protein
MGDRLSEISINGRTLTTGMEVTLERSPGRRQGRYRFDWAELDRNGNPILNVYGPLRARGAIPHYRLAGVGAVRTVHVKTANA